MSNGMTKDQHHEFMSEWKKENIIPDEWPQYDLDMLWAKYEMYKRVTGEEMTINIFSESWALAFIEGAKTKDRRGVLKGLLKSKLGQTIIQKKGMSPEEVQGFMDSANNQ